MGEIDRALQAIGERWVSEAKRRLRGHRVTGRLADSISLARAQAGVLEVVATAPYASFVEHGTRPHRPPSAPLLSWAARRGIQNGWGVIHAIAEKGTAPHPFLEPVVESTKGWVLRQLDQAVEREVQNAV